MPTMVVSFLGRGPYTPSGVRLDYFQTSYQFADWCSDKVPFFLEAMLCWLREKRQCKLAKLIVLGTSGSMWDALVCRLVPMRDEIETMWIELSQRVDSSQVTKDDLLKVEQVLSDALDLEVRTELILPGQSKPDQAQILFVLQQHVQASDRVYLDVTHGYRHQPMLGLGAAAFLTRARGATVEDIFYGAIEMRGSKDAPAPVVSLRWLLDLLAASDSVERFRTGGSLAGLEAVIPNSENELIEVLAKTAFFVSTNQIARATQAAHQALTLLQKAETDPLLDLMRPSIAGSLSKITACRRNPRGILELARLALRQQDYLRAAALLSEAADAATNELGVKLNRKHVNAIKTLRNAVVHASEAGWARISQVMDSPKEMSRFLHEQIEWLDKSMPLLSEDSSTTPPSG